MKWIGVCLVCALLAGAVLLYTNQRRQQTYVRTAVAYEIPDLTLINQHAQTVELRPLLLGKQAVMLEFSYTRCTSLCADQAVKFANLQRRTGQNPQQVRLISISIDPQIDTPAVLKDYLDSFQAQPGWDYLTGSPADIHQLMQIFDISPTNMVTLKSSLLLHKAGADQWIRIDGQLSATDLLREYQTLIKAD